ncbi:MAG TPA: DUF2306 domain-containing protein [Tahibacter sp.]|uniref:DUF2306 domain-containing protein n=1 Tax=Tahibacter sp. TaxID=2056211 RepID=UPI002D1004CF|nr:DUF2306 domain-containing protein [Tahibacter sp.]HSX61042.1 DUF2306 domain-containing protein [Tahibacter sp.]
MASTTGSWARRCAHLVFAVLCVAVAAYAFHFLYGEFRPRNPFDRRFAVGGIAVPAHFFGAGLALALAPFQVWARLRGRLPRAHRVGGWLYAGGVLTGGIGGLAMATDAHGGWASGAAFALLGVVWIASTALGVGFAIAGDIARHRRWMWRSVALTASAVTLRLELAIGQGALQLPFLITYVFAAWSCWTINLAIVEWWLRRRPSARRMLESGIA